MRNFAISIINKIRFDVYKKIYPAGKNSSDTYSNFSDTSLNLSDTTSNSYQGSLNSY